MRRSNSFLNSRKKIAVKGEGDESKEHDLEIESEDKVSFKKQKELCARFQGLWGIPEKAFFSAAPTPIHPRNSAGQSEVPFRGRPEPKDACMRFQSWT